MTANHGSDNALQGARLSRRTLLGGFAGMATAAILAACGDTAATQAPRATTGATGSTAATSGATVAPAMTAASGSTAATPPAGAGTTATQPAAAGAVKRGGMIRAEIDSDVANLDPLASSLLVDRQVLYNMYDSLVTIDKDLKIIPSLAEKWETPDAKTYIFTLRTGVKYHDGTDFDAASVKWNIERYLTDKGSRRAAEINSIATVEVVNATTVKFNLKAAFAPLLANLVDRAGMMVSQKAAEAGGMDFTRKPLGGGTGAFKFVEWVKDDHITLERNATYWKKDASGGQLPYVDKVNIRPIVDSTVALTNLKTGDVDVSHYLPPKDYASTKAGKELVLQDTPALSYASVVLNCAAEPFNKKEFRQAFAEAMDRDQIIKTVFFGIGQPNQGPIPTSSWAYDPALKPYTANVAKAKEYLKAGGKPDGFSFDMKITAGSPETTQLAQLLKDQVAKAGMTMNLIQLDFPTLVADQQAGKFGASLAGWSGRIDPDGNMYNQLRTGAAGNDAKFSDPMVDELMDKARTTVDQGERKGIYQQVQRLIVENAPLVYYRAALSYLLTRPNVLGMTLYPDSIMRFETASLK